MAKEDFTGPKKKVLGEDSELGPLGKGVVGFFTDIGEARESQENFGRSDVDAATGRPTTVGGEKLLTRPEPQVRDPDPLFEEETDKAKTRGEEIEDRGPSPAIDEDLDRAASDFGQTGKGKGGIKGGLTIEQRPQIPQELLLAQQVASHNAAQAKMAELEVRAQTYGVEGLFSQQMADVMDDDADETIRIVEERLDATDKIAGDMSEAMQLVRTNQINPGQFFSNIGAGGTFAAALNVMVGEIGSSLVGGPNNALGIINDAIDRDLAAQEFNLLKEERDVARQGMFLQQNRQITQDIVAARQLSRAMMMESAAQRLNAMSMAANSQIMRTQAAQVAALAQQESVAALIEAVQSAAKTSFTFPLSVVKDTKLMQGYINSVQDSLNQLGQAQLPPELQGREQQARGQAAALGIRGGPQQTGGRAPAGGQAPALADGGVEPQEGGAPTQAAAAQSLRKGKVTNVKNADRAQAVVAVLDQVADEVHPLPDFVRQDANFTREQNRELTEIRQRRANVKRRALIDSFKQTQDPVTEAEALLLYEQDPDFRTKYRKAEPLETAIRGVNSFELNLPPITDPKTGRVFEDGGTTNVRQGFDKRNLWKGLSADKKDERIRAVNALENGEWQIRELINAVRRLGTMKDVDTPLLGAILRGDKPAPEGFAIDITKARAIFNNMVNIVRQTKEGGALHGPGEQAIFRASTGFNDKWQTVVTEQFRGVQPVIDGLRGALENWQQEYRTYRTSIGILNGRDLLRTGSLSTDEILEKRGKQENARLRGGK